MKDAPPAVPAAAEQQSSVRSQNSRLGLLVASAAPYDDTADGVQPPGNQPGSVISSYIYFPSVNCLNCGITESYVSDNNKRFKIIF